jgi:hypothetical protein
MRYTGLLAGLIATACIALSGPAAAVGRDGFPVPVTSGAASQALVVAAANPHRFGGELLNRIIKKKKGKGWGWGRHRLDYGSPGGSSDDVLDPVDDVIDLTEDVVEDTNEIEYVGEIVDADPDGPQAPSEDDLEECRLTQEVCAE